MFEIENEMKESAEEATVKYLDKLKGDLTSAQDKLKSEQEHSSNLMKKHLELTESLSAQIEKLQEENDILRQSIKDNKEEEYF